MGSILMGKRIELIKGDYVGGLGISYVKEFKNKKKERYCVFHCCSCGSEFICMLSNIRHNKVKSCGCASSVAATNTE